MHHMTKPIIEYPCEWSYKVIGTDEKQLRKAAEMYLSKADYRVSFSNNSSSGKYISLDLETVVPNEEARNQIYTLPANHPSVKMVL